MLCFFYTQNFKHFIPNFSVFKAYYWARCLTQWPSAGLACRDPGVYSQYCAGGEGEHLLSLYMYVKNTVLKATFSCLLMVKKLCSEAQKNYIPGSDRNLNKKAVSRKGTNSQQNKPSARDAELSCLVYLAPTFPAQPMLHRYSLSGWTTKKPRVFPYSLITGSFHLNCGLWPFGNCLFRFSSSMMLFAM